MSSVPIAVIPELPADVSLEQLLAVLRPLAWGAADILRAYARGLPPPFGFDQALQVEEGGDGPVSAADLAVNRWLLEGLSRAFPQTPWDLISEESAKADIPASTPASVLSASSEGWLWILDPLDGTRDFLQGTGEYAVHLALVRRQRPVLGAVLLPEAEELWLGVLDRSGGGGEAWCEGRSGERRPVRFSARASARELVLVASRNHRDQRLEHLLAALPLAERRSMGSVGGKIATILRGESDLYISLSGRSAPMDWDMAAPEVVLRAAGGQFSHADGRPLLYNTGDPRQPGCLIASHGPAHAEICIAAVTALASIDPGFAV
ncbi:MAG: 3'(2'),5'-bisphosphate nucleotidase CysQ [Synechococcaceae cyanobacterium]